ncbi:MAG: SET domain-containing protein-lysine N-methyltransferase [Nanoarchaeota archaeon]
MRAYFSNSINSGLSLISGYGSFAIKPIMRGEVIIDFSSAPQIIISKAEADKKYSTGFDHMLQIGKDSFLVTVNNDNEKRFGHVNHSCDPNCGIKNKMQFVAMRDIPVGEEITFDYAMSESTDYSFVCSCQSPKCRGLVTGNDWKNKFLQKKYDGFFSQYIYDKIDEQKVLSPLSL